MTDVDYKKIAEALYEEINKVRTDPKSFIPYAKNAKKYFTGLEYKNPSLGGTITTAEGVAAVDELIQFLERQPKIHKLEKNLNIEKACKKLSDYLGSKGLTGNQKGEYSLQSRLEKYLGYAGLKQQSTAYGGSDAMEILFDLLNCDGLKNRNHRNNIFSVNCGMFGVSIAKHIEYESVTVIDFFGDDDHGDGIQYEGRKTLIRDKDTDYPNLSIQVYNEVNNVRENPKSYINHLKTMKGNFDGKDYKDTERNLIIETEEGLSGIDDAIFYLEKQSPLKKLGRNEGLENSAKQMLTHIGPKGSVRHEKGEMSLKSRIDKHLNKSGIMGENLSFGNNKAINIVCQIIIDDGVKSRGHRKNLFEERYSHFGVSCGYHKVYGTATVFNFLGPNSNNNDNLDKYEIDRAEWPEKAVQVEQRCKIETLHDRKKIYLAYQFTLENGEKVQKFKEIEEMVQ